MKLLDLREYIRVYDNVFPDDICTKLINVYELCSHEEFDTSFKKFKWINLNKNKQFLPEFDMVVGTFTQVFNQYREEVPFGEWIPKSNHQESIKIKKYPPNGYFKDHVDSSFWETAMRYLSAFTYLNDSEGTRFWNDLVIEGKKGRVVVFPPNWLYPHASLNGKSVKYFMGTYMHFDPPARSSVG